MSGCSKLLGRAIRLGFNLVVKSRRPRRSLIRCVLLCMLEAVEGGFCLLEVLEVPEVMRCMLLRMLEAVEGGICCWSC